MARFRAMGGPCEVLVETDHEAEARDVAQAAMTCASRIESKFSRYLPHSVVARINSSAGAPTPVDDETANLLDFAARAHALSGGLFDITSGVLRRAWTFDGSANTPDPSAVRALLPLVGWSRVNWDRPVLTLREGMQIDFGGIAKEYAVDQAARAAAAASPVPSLVNFAGDLAVTRARAGNLPWRVGIERAESAAAVAGLVDIVAGALATSGDTHRFVTAGGQRLPHILDPRTGQPVRGAPHSVTVAAPTCTLAGMLTTLAMLQGTDAETFLEAEGVRFWIQRGAAH